MLLWDCSIVLLQGGGGYEKLASNFQLARCHLKVAKGPPKGNIFIEAKFSLNLKFCLFLCPFCYIFAQKREISA